MIDRIPPSRFVATLLSASVASIIFTLPAAPNQDPGDQPPAQDRGTEEVIEDMERELDAERANQPVAPTSARDDDARPVARRRVDRARPMLLREGGFLTRATGVLSLDEVLGVWVFDLDASAEGAGASSQTISLIVLPCSRLRQMQRAVETSPDQPVFEVTGRVFVYEKRNYLLPTMPARLDRFQRPPRSAESAPASDPPTSGADESTEDLIRRMREDIPLPRGLDPDIDQDEEIEAGPPVVAEGSILLSRRGQIRRGSHGGWVFVFDADAAGLADPPMILLPCLLLERMRARYEESALSGASGPPMTVSGQVFVYRGRNYLLPTLFQITREKTVIYP